MIVVRATEEFEAWLQSLDQRDLVVVQRAIALLRTAGVLLGAPHASALRGTRFPLRELRPKRGQSPLRVIYAFDPRREALLILEGSKAADARFYVRGLGRAEVLWARHLKESGEGVDG